MPHLNYKGPENKGSKTGRKLGICNTIKEIKDYELGQGMGLKRKSGSGKGLARRLKSSKLFEDKE